VSVSQVAVPCGTTLGLGHVLIVGLAGHTTTCSFESLTSLTVALLVSPLYVASHWYLPVTVPVVGSV